MLPMALLSIVFSFPTFILFPLSDIKLVECTSLLAG